jgi:phospholipid transport system substrate-binding protein
MWKKVIIKLGTPLVLGWGLAGLLPQVASAQTPGLLPPQQVIEDGSDRLREVLRSDRELLKRDPAYVFRLVDQEFLPHVDFDRVASLALGKYWRAATPDQRKAFQDEFKRFLIRSYSFAIDELSEWDIRYAPLRMSPGDKEVVVRTEVMRSGGTPVAANYSMHLRAGRWQVYDVTIEGVSLISNYRSGFAQTIRSKGLDGLIAELAQRNQERGATGS